VTVLSSLSLARVLETGRFDGRAARAASALWAAIAERTLVRPQAVDADVGVVCVGGATLGGSGKTRVAVACAKRLASAGARVVLVGHAYRASPGRPRVVAGDDPLHEVGDEARASARALAKSGARVVVAASRAEALAHALALGPDVLVLDGPLRLRRTRRRQLSLLAVDRYAPWGAGRVPPAGDLRAPPEALLACADHVVPVDAAGEGIARLAGVRAGLFTALARPRRLLAALAQAGVEIVRHVAIADHGPRTARATAELTAGPVDVWLATEKCAQHLEDLDLPLVTLSSEVGLPPEVDEALTARSVRTWATDLHGMP
jgi:tetraacyldisaccharide 4'-kinase